MFLLKYHGNWSITETYNLPILIRRWFLKRLVEQKEKEAEEAAKAEVSDYWGVYVEPTYYVSPNVGLFVKGGYSEVTVNTLESISSGTDSSAYGNETINGLLIGAGFESDMAIVKEF